MIVKAKRIMDTFISETRYQTDQLYLGSVSNREPEPYPIGKVTLVYKVGKKRKMVTGRIEVESYSSQYTGLNLEYFFVPSTPVQVEKVRKMLAR